MTGSFLIVWSIRLSMVSLVSTLLAWLLIRSGNRNHAGIRWLWTISFLLFVVHVCSSFHFVHHWSHQQAYQDTAAETKRLMGIEFGGGVYFNYLFLLAWAIHVWLTWRPQLQQSILVRVLLQLILVYMLFIAFNGVVVFKSGWLRSLGLIATVLLIAAAAWWMTTGKLRVAPNHQTR